MKGVTGARGNAPGLEMMDMTPSHEEIDTAVVKDFAWTDAWHQTHDAAVTVSFQVEEDASGPKQTNWHLYNQGRMHELPMFERLAWDLIAGLNPLPREPPKGRPPVPLREAVYCGMLKLYAQKSSRRAQGLIDRAVDQGKLSRPWHFNVVSRLLNAADTAAVLRQLIQVSSTPLAELERIIAIDGTGFATQTFGPYFGARHGVKRTHHFVKAVLAFGVKTHIITDVVVGDGRLGESPQWPELVRNTASRFAVEAFLGDKGFSSKKNHDVAEAVGSQARIPFKKNVTGRAKGSGAWKRAYHYWQSHPQDFLRRYHQRSNAESGIAAVKKVLGETLYSKNQRARCNELLLKFLTYNVLVLAHEIYESGIDVTFTDSLLIPV